MKRFVTFGEIMLRLNPEGFLRFVQTDRFEATYAGGEANVAVSLASFGDEVAFVTKLPENPLGEAARNALRRFGVATDEIVWGGRRLGIYFVEKGASQRASRVIYDRVGSSIACATRGDFDWDRILAGADWFHFTGITPALGGELPAICADALACCRRRGIAVSCDLNYRSRLWSRKDSERTMTRLMPFVDVLIANEADAADVFGIAAEGSDVEKGSLSKPGYVSVARQLTERFGMKRVAITLRTSLSASRNLWAGMLYADGEAFFSREYDIQIVDRVGGGDSFVGGLLHAIALGMGDGEAIEFAAAASALKHSIEHDFNVVSEAEVSALAAGGSAGRIQR